VVRLDGEARELRLLVDHRDDLVKERTKLQSRLRWHLHELFPGLEIAPKALRRFHVMSEVEERLEGIPGTVPRIAQSSWSAVGTSPSGPTSSSVSHRARPAVGSSLLSLPGCGVLSAAKIVASRRGPVGSAPKLLLPA